MKVILIVLLVLKLFAIVNSQSQSGEGPGASVSNSGDYTNSIQPTSSDRNTPTDSHSSASQTDNASVSDTTSNTVQSSYQPQTSSTATSSTSTASSTRSDHSRTQDNNSQTPSSISSAKIGPTASSSPSNTSAPSGDGSNNVAKIAGGVVGGVVGIALIGGLLTWLNRRGGCTSRTKRRHHDTMNDFALQTNDKIGEGASSPFQRRMAPLVSPPTAGYLNMGNDDVNHDRMAGYPSSHVPDSQHGYSDAQSHSPFDATAGPSDPWRQQEKQEHYNASSTSLQSPNVHDRRVKPDAVDYKPHEI